MPATIRRLVPILSLNLVVSALGVPTSADTLPSVSIALPADGSTVPGSEPLPIWSASFERRDHDTWAIALVQMHKGIGADEGEPGGITGDLEVTP